MENEYKRICTEMFGTDDIEQIRNKLKQKERNTRNAGRKSSITKEQIKELVELRARGMSVNALAEKYAVTRQVISKYWRNATEKPKYTIRMTVQDKIIGLCAKIYVDFLHKKVAVENYTDDIIMRPFGVVTEPTWDDFEDFLEYRCWERGRQDIKMLLKGIGVDNYDPLQIVEKTKGRMADDNIWIEIEYSKGNGQWRKLKQ